MMREACLSVRSAACSTWLKRPVAGSCSDTMPSASFSSSGSQWRVSISSQYFTSASTQAALPPSLISAAGVHQERHLAAVGQRVVADQPVVRWSSARSMAARNVSSRVSSHASSIA
jgi:hypothetical protein